MNTLQRVYTSREATKQVEQQLVYSRSKVGARCQHCNIRKSRSDGPLCQACYRDQEVRHLYLPPTDNRSGVIPQPKELNPLGGTDALPGTEEKIRILQRRFVLGVSLYHPEDAGIPEKADRCWPTCNSAQRVMRVYMMDKQRVKVQGGFT